MISWFQSFAFKWVNLYRYAWVEMAFHDTSRAGRLPTITDYHSYSIGVLGERGCALASPGKADGGAVHAASSRKHLVSTLGT